MLIPNTRADIHARVHRTDDKGRTVTMIFPVVGWQTDGRPLIAEALPLRHGTVTRGRICRADTYGDYELIVWTPPKVDTATEIVEVIPGSDRELEYQLPDGSTFRGVVPLWGRREDGTVVALVTAEPVPVRHTVERDPDGQIVASVETSEP